MNLGSAIPRRFKAGFEIDIEALHSSFLRPLLPPDPLTPRLHSTTRANSARTPQKQFPSTFVEVEEGVEGLVHISELSWTKRIARPSDVLSVGQEIE